MKKLWIILGVVLVFLLMLVGTYVSNYNRLVRTSESINSSWAQVENQLQRRFDLIPNLINTVKGYVKHEKGIFEYVADARAKLAGAKTIADKVKSANDLETGLSRLLAIAENYPQLKANENFIRLQDELAGTENRIAVERMRFNEIVRDYNILIRRFPSNIIASMSGFEKKDIYFKAEETAKETPKVNF
ncbi:MAG: LemA family protein [Candidatus Firestonebacteria bacterium]